MKTHLIKLSTLCLISGILLTACVKKEEPKTAQEENPTQQTTSTKQTLETPEALDEVILTEEITPEETVTVSETQHTRTEITSRPVARSTVSEPTYQAATPTVSTYTNSEQSAQVEAPQTEVAAAAPQQESVATPQAAVDHNTAASVDDAVAQALQAAKPALESN